MGMGVNGAKMTRLLFLVFLTVSAASGLRPHRVHVPHRRPDGRIIGGHEATPHSVPFEVGLLINGDAFCGASLISPNYVLTAAHCGVVIWSVTVILGAHNRTSNEPTQIRYTDLNASAVIVHENYSRSTYENDIALIKLPEPAPINDYIKPVKLPSKADADRSYLDKMVRATGWGLTQDKPHAGIDDISDVLMYVDVKVMESEECAEYFNEPGSDFINDRNFCTSGYKNRGTCGGDSGGPLVYEDVQVGVTSFGSEICETCTPSVYTSVGKFLQWIEDHSDVNNS